MRSGGHLLVEALIGQGVDTCFGVPGESFLAALDGFHEHAAQIRFVTCRHEGGAAFMAEAWGKATGGPGVCFVTRGPGATNAGIGVHTASQDSTPMLLLVGQVASADRHREAFQELDVASMFGAGTLGMAKWAAEIPAVERIPELVARAFSTVLNGRQGPVVLALPEDVLTSATDAAPLPRVEAVRSAPAPSDLERLLAELTSATRPFVIVGGSGWTAEGTRRLEEFAERWQLPVGCAFRFQDLFDNAHPSYAGDVGIGIGPALARRIESADLVIAIGARLGEMTTSGYTLLTAPRPRQRLVHIHAGAEELGRVHSADVAIAATMDDAAIALAALAPPAGELPWTTLTRAAHEEHLANQSSPRVEPLDLAEVVRSVQRLAPKDAVLTNGAGNFSGWLHRFCTYRARHQHGRTQLAPTSGAMGYGVPAGIAASLLDPDRTVVTFTGDGDFLMTNAELATAIAHGVQRLIVIVVDNGSYGTIRMHQEREFPGRSVGTDLVNPDFVALARAYGWEASRVERTGQFDAVFTSALRSERPTLLHLVHDVEQITSRTTLTGLRATTR